MGLKRTEKISDFVKEGEILEVKYLGLDPKTRKPKVSRKALLPRPPREDKKPEDNQKKDNPQG